MEFGIRNVIFIVLFLAAMGFLGENIHRLISYLKTAKQENKTDRILDRIKKTLNVALFQSKIMRDPVAGPIHAGIFWGFLVLMFSAASSIMEGFGVRHFFDFMGPVWTLITLSTDIFIPVVIVAVIWAAQRRFILKEKRLQVEGEAGEAALILTMIFTIVTSLMLENAANIKMGIDAQHALRPFAGIIAGFLSADIAPYIHEVGFWLHIGVIMAFMNFLPYSKHLHVYTSIPNVFISSIEYPNKLEKMNFEDENLTKYGIVDIDDLNWKSMMDGYSCTHCGRCTSVCPANLTGKQLDPREIIVQVRERTFDIGDILVKKQKFGEDVELSEIEQQKLAKTFVGEYQNIDAIWQCTTCGACMQECPVSIEHVPVIVGMRRNLAMMEANFSPELQTTFGNLETNSTPWAFSSAERADWAEGLEIPTAADTPDFDILFWVGCAGSYDDRAKKISVAFSKLMQKAGVNFAILGTEEACNGDVARRAGNEYLANMLITMNMETLTRYNVKKIVTICPHCFNTFRNEYKDFGGEFEVVHHTEFLNQLIKDGKLTIKAGSKMEIAYHDSCYLGRYNDVYEAPRNVIESVPGLNILEADRHHDRGLCCGAGGGQMFMEETEGKRVNIERTEELLATGATTIAANCPFCMTMISDGVKSKDKDEEVKVLDIAEILLEHVE
jgi:Fe-S oxidoreductase